MKTGIRFKIFIPVFTVLLLFPIASYLMFGAISKNYMDKTARRDLNMLVTEAGKMIEELQSGADMKDEDEWRLHVKEFLQKMKARLKTETAQASMMIFNAGYKLTYPKQKELPGELTELYRYMLTSFAGGQQEQALSADGPVEIGGQNYLLHLLELPGSGRQRAKYLVAYIPVQDHTALLKSAGYLVFFITACLAALSCIVVWVVSGNLQKPLQALCRHADHIGEGDFAPMEQEISVKEIDELRRVVNGMAEKLEHSGQAQNAFFQNASHELRTPLMSICGYAQGIQKGVFPDVQRAAEIIASESIRLKTMVDGILTISRLDNKSISYHPCLICLNDFLEEHLEKLSGLEELENIQSTLIKPEQELYVMADSGLLTNVIHNVLSDSMKYAKNQVLIRLTEEERRAVITVEDDGDGFDEQDLPHVFERFYKGKTGNFGIGLSVARASVEQLEGRIQAINGKKGAVFIISLCKYEQNIVK